MKPIENILFSSSFIEKLMRDHLNDDSIAVHQVERLPVDNSASILVALTSGQTERVIGHFGLNVTFSESGTRKTKSMVMKVKPKGEEITSMLTTLAQACGNTLALVYPEYKTLTGFTYTHVREQELYKKLPGTITPIIYGVDTDFKKDHYIILMEYLQNVTLLNSVMAPESFTDSLIKDSLEQMAVWHAQHYDRPLPIQDGYWDDRPSLSSMKKLIPVWDALLKNATANFPELYNTQRVKFLQYAIDQIPQYWSILESLPKTLIHNDFNPRNICFKSVENRHSICVYDWELSTFHIPQYDVVEFLCFVLDEDRYDLRPYYLEHYRKALEQFIPSFSDSEKFSEETEMAALDFGLHRLGMYMMAHTVSPYPFLPRVIKSYFNLLEQSKFMSVKAL